MKKSLILFLLLFCFLDLQNTYARDNLSQLFKTNSAIIYTLNIRNFGAKDLNNDGIIEEDLGDIKGTFLNAKDKLEELKNQGINTIYLLPITKVGKLKALGNAGSLYAMDSFFELNPEFDDLEDKRTVYEEAKAFINKAHELDLNVIVDLPSCGSYDLSLLKPNWFILDKDNESKIPSDWTDVRLFKVYNGKNLNQDTLDNYKLFVKIMQDLGFDGIRADVAGIKPPEFWKTIIESAKERNKNFIFIAEASPDWTNPAPDALGHYSTVDELLNAGFDGYYGSFSDFKNIKTKKEFDSKIEKNLKILSKHKNTALLATFATHDQRAPILRGENYWEMILWLTATMPLNSYFLDGFSTGDDFIYNYENQKALSTLTDDEYYFVHNGMFDIFNTTAPVREKRPYLKEKYQQAINFKIANLDIFKYGKYKTLETKNERVFAYSMKYLTKEIIVSGSLDEINSQKITLKLNSLDKKKLYEINEKQKPKQDKDKIELTFEPLEIKVFLIK